MRPEVLASQSDQAIVDNFGLIMDWILRVLTIVETSLLGEKDIMN